MVYISILGYIIYVGYIQRTTRINNYTKVSIALCLMTKAQYSLKPIGASTPSSLYLFIRLVHSGTSATLNQH